MKLGTTCFEKDMEMACVGGAGGGESWRFMVKWALHPGRDRKRAEPNISFPILPGIEQWEHPKLCDPQGSVSILLPVKPWLILIQSGRGGAGGSQVRRVMSICFQW